MYYNSLIGSIADGHLNTFQMLAVINVTVMNSINVFGWTYIVDIYIDMKLLGHSNE